MGLEGRGWRGFNKPCWDVFSRGRWKGLSGLERLSYNPKPLFFFF